MTDVVVVLAPQKTIVVSEPSATPAVSVEVSKNPSSIVEVNHGIPGPPGPAGPPGNGTGGSLGAEFTYTVPSATWIIPIPAEFTRRPSVSIYNSLGEEVETDVFISTNTVTITFHAPFTGMAVLN